MSACATHALEDPKPTREELEQKIRELTELLHVAFLTICRLECERDRAVHATEIARANRVAMHDVRTYGLLAVMQRYDSSLWDKPEHPLVEGAVRLARRNRGLEIEAASDPLTWNCPHIGADGWGCGAAAGQPCDWSHDPAPKPFARRDFHAERKLMADGGGGAPVPADTIERAADDLV